MLKKEINLLGLILLATALIWGCQNKTEHYTLTGKINGLDSGKVFLAYFIKTDSLFYDSTELNKGTFTFTGSTNEPRAARLFPEGYDGIDIDFFLENTEITMELTATDSTLERTKISGSPLTTEYDLLVKLLEPIGLRTYGLSNQLNEENVSLAEYDSLMQLFEEVSTQYDNQLKEYAQSHPLSIVALSTLINAEFDQENLSYYEDFLKALDPTLLKTVPGQKLTTLIEIAKRTALQQPAMDFSLPDITGKTVRLLDFQASYLLVDFWASWCGPCRNESPNLVDAYQQYHDAGFDIVSVSIDRDEERWKNAVEEDGYTWTNLIDREGKASDQYGVQAIPYNLLLDKSGKIIAKNLRGNDLKLALDQYLKAN